MNQVKKVMVTALFLGLCVTAFAQRRGAADQEDKEPFLAVTGVVAGTQASLLGLTEGDVIQSYGGRIVQSRKDLKEAIEDAEDSAEVIVVRGEEVFSLMFSPGGMGILVEQRLPELEFDPDAEILDGIAYREDEVEKNNTFILSLSRVANFLGDELDYTKLMGISGAAFRFQMHYSWERSAVLADHGYRTDLVALDAAGYEYAYYELAEDWSNQDSIRREITASIDAGSPVIAYDLMGEGKWGIITGYQGAAGRNFIVRVFDTTSMKRAGYTIATGNFPPKVFIIEGRTVPASEKDIFIRSFDIAQEMLDPAAENIDEYYIGL
ncbi:hypothetical protein GF359_04810, partial [candidate division WOR-3 bacterium]|nr:hypothetical protein [candidate division WOR-3 bacterium]MBD3364516.1 hypothetical protein [candidate division WOR-3 bacterium]